MGIYIFNRNHLVDVLRRDAENEASSHDFGNDILPALIGKAKVFAYPFGGKGGRVTQDRYWRDVGTLDAYYEANMALLEAGSPDGPVPGRLEHPHLCLAAPPCPYGTRQIRS